MIKIDFEKINFLTPMVPPLSHFLTFQIKIKWPKNEFTAETRVSGRSGEPEEQFVLAHFSKY